MTIVVGTAGHIDHGKTTLLRALTGIDADRLPEERRRGMTIDVGYAHLILPDGSELDFVDVPGHDRLVGNMLVGAGEIDAAMLVVAADDGPRAQTLEHLALLSALGLRHGIAVVTKIDAAGEERTASVLDEVAALLAGTSLRDSPVLAVSSTSGEGIDALRVALVALRDRALGPGTGVVDPRSRRDFASISPRDRSRVRGQGSRRGRDRDPARRAARRGFDTQAGAGRSGGTCPRDPGPWRRRRIGRPRANGAQREWRVTRQPAPRCRPHR